MNTNSVTVLVFKFSIVALLGIIFVSGLTLFFFFYLLISAPGFLWLFLPVATFIIYIRYSKKALFKTRIIDENKLTFSTEGIQYGDEFYPVSEIEAVALYLYAFDNFEYRDGFVYRRRESSVYVRAPGDRNTISFRFQEKVFDFDFYLEDFARFCAVRKVINDWASEGVNVVLKQPFADDFIIQEMDYYHTPSGL
jgi:hypothetical protein